LSTLGAASGGADGADGEVPEMVGVALGVGMGSTLGTIGASGGAVLESEKTNISVSFFKFSESGSLIAENGWSAVAG